MAGDNHIDIRPRVTILSVLQHLNYEPWFALAEFVDNSIQSFAENRAALGGDGSSKGRVRVSIEVEHGADGKIVIRDDAAGIAMADFPRAFRAAELPPDRSNLAEFGMGMKSAACWFAPKWTVRTKALGETVERTVKFDIAAIVEEGVERIPYKETRAAASSHYTEITLYGPRSLPTRTLGKVRDHLADIYRQFLRDGTLELHVAGKRMKYEEPEVLKAPVYGTDNAPSGPERAWLKRVSFKFRGGGRVEGFAGILQVGSLASAGFSLFRRRRLIVGSHDKKWRPASIFGAPNDYAYQRVFGELDVEGVEVSHTKDGFRWNGMDAGLETELLKQLDAPPLPLLKQARNYRARRARADSTGKATAATNHTATAIIRNAPVVLEGLVNEPGPASPPTRLAATPPATDLAARTFNLHFSDRDWAVSLEIVNDPAIGDWLSFCKSSRAGGPSSAGDEITVRMNIAHPFCDRFLGPSMELLDPMLRLAAGLALAERAAIDSRGGPGAVRLNLNALLRDALARE